MLRKYFALHMYHKLHNPIPLDIRGYSFVHKPSYSLEEIPWKRNHQPQKYVLYTFVWDHEGFLFPSLYF